MVGNILAGGLLVGPGAEIGIGAFLVQIAPSIPVLEPIATSGRRPGFYLVKSLILKGRNCALNKCKRRPMPHTRLAGGYLFSVSRETVAIPEMSMSTTPT